MTNLFSQGKIIRQFWGKIIRQSTRNYAFLIAYKNSKTRPGGGMYIFSLSNPYY